VKYQFIADHDQAYPVTLMCRVLGVVRSGYYRWCKTPVGKRKMADMILSMHIKDIFKQSRDTYGSYRIQATLVDEGIRCGRKRVARLVRENDLKPKAVRRFKVMTTDSKHKFPVASNVLDQDFTAQSPDQIWLSDITYVATAEGWLYLAAVMDLYSRRIVGWAMSDSLHRQLVIDALQMAITARQPLPGLLHHSDRGSQYASDEYQALLTQYQMVGTVPVSRQGNCYDNAPMESFFGTFKTELIFDQDYATRNEAKLDIFEYIEVFYNRYRRHSSLGYKSPANYEALPLVA
jgi:transposase InsO family protein